MSDRVFVIVSGLPSPDVGIEVRNAQLRSSLIAYITNMTDEQLEKGIVTFPDGPGDPYLLPARVENA